MQTDELSAALSACLGELPQRSRQMIEYRYVEGRTVSQITALLGLRPGTAYQAFYRTHRVLGDCVERRLANEGGCVVSVSHDDERVFFELLDRYYDGQSTAEEMTRLNEMLRGNDALVRAMHRVGMIGAGVRDLRAMGRAHDAEVAGPAIAGSTRRVPIRTSLAIAAALLIAAGGIAVVAFVLSGREEAATHNSPTAQVASLINADTTLIVDDQVAVPGESYRAGVYSIESGAAELLLTNRVGVKLTGRTSLTMRSNMSSALTSGRAEFDCPHTAKGYAVELPGEVRVVDLGTAFVVRAMGDFSDVRVTGGHVAVESPGLPGRPIELAAGLTARIDDRGGVTVSRPIESHTGFGEATRVLSDGRGAGFGTPDDITDPQQADTVNGWTWYTIESAANADLTIPFGGSTATLGEQLVRQVERGELAHDAFRFGWGKRDTAIALRSPTYAGVAAGEAAVDWDATDDRLRVYLSQDAGATWRLVARGVEFAVAAGELGVVFVGNDGVDSNTFLRSVTIRYPLAVDPRDPASNSAEPSR